MTTDHPKRTVEQSANGQNMFSGIAIMA